VRPLADVAIMLIELDAGGSVELPVAPGRTIFLYLISGDAEIGGSIAPAHHLVELDGDGDGVAIAAPSGARILFGHGPAFAEPIVAHGPFVMNSREEIVQAIADYQAGRFGRL
jgi:redox-sensitive bicupin YhaK (pirin superfamily)